MTPDDRFRARSAPVEIMSTGTSQISSMRFK